MLNHPLLRWPVLPLAAALWTVSGLAGCSGPDQPAAKGTPPPAASTGAPSAPAPPTNSLESSVRTMTGAIPRARSAAADLNQRSGENAAAANAVQ